MKRRNGILCVVVINVLLSGVCFGYSDKGFQWWNTTGVSFDVAKDWKCTFEQEFRLGDDGGNLYYEHQDLGFVYSGLGEWIDLGANFRYISEKSRNDDWVQENRPHLNATFKWSMLGLWVSDRNRFEYRDREEEEDVWRYRNKVTAKFPFELTPLKLKPYVADEIFITMNDDNVDKNRFYAGASFELTKGLDMDIYYMWQASRSAEEWIDINVLGTALKFTF
jgi:hypothetical protein